MPTNTDTRETELVRSYADSNQELVASFGRYMESRGLSSNSIRSYGAAVDEFVHGFGNTSLIESRRADVHNFLARLLKRGLADNSVDLKTKALRCFFKFLRFASLVQIDPMLQVGHRKIRERLPRVLTVEEVERVIAAAQTPAERAIVETLYATGVRVSELCGIRLENIIFPEHMILIERGKGGKDRWVIYGRHAALAIAKYLEWRPSKAGYLFESPAREGGLFVSANRWHIRFYAKDRCQHVITIGKVADLPTESDARAAWEKISSHIPDCAYRPNEPRPQGLYTARGISQMLARLGHTAGVEGIHPHSLRRSMACHMLAHGADIRAIQELLGHKNLSTTQRYTTLTNEKVAEVYRKAHPHAESDRGNDAPKKY